MSEKKKDQMSSTHRLKCQDRKQMLHLADEKIQDHHSVAETFHENRSLRVSEENDVTVTSDPESAADKISLPVHTMEDQMSSTHRLKCQDRKQILHQADEKIQDHHSVAETFHENRSWRVSEENDVTVTSDPESVEGKICLLVHTMEKVVPITVKNFRDTAVFFNLDIKNIVNNVFTVKDCQGNIITTIEQHVLGAGESYQLNVHFSTCRVGFYEHVLFFNFEECQNPSVKYDLVRVLEIFYLFSPPDEAPRPATVSLYPQQVKRCSVKKRYKMTMPLKKYFLPYGTNDVTKTHNTQPLRWHNYTQRFHKLLYLEERSLKKEVEENNRYNVPISRHHNPSIFILQIPSSWSSKLSHCHVILTPMGQSKGSIGWIHHVEQKQVYVRMVKGFQRIFVEGMWVNLKFCINRTPLRTQHRAIDLMYKHKLRKVLFPSQRPASPLRCKNRLLMDVEGNPEQCTAIKHILSGTSKPAPYLLFGPPGTGKTTTLIKTIKQIVKTRSKILVCAPSNTATDHLCEKILEDNIHGVFRFYAASSLVKNIPETLKHHCNLNTTCTALMAPSQNKLKRYKIIVTTLINAGRLVSEGIRPGHFTHIFVDEACQASETENVVAIGGLMKEKKCQLVLTGDPKQLGPIIKSQLAMKTGLGVPLMERLMKNRLYRPHKTRGFNKCFITKLVRNYRSHPAILEIPNQLFYGGQLQANAPTEDRNSFCEWERLPTKGFPLIFHGVEGINELDEASPSFYNRAEVEVVKDYLKVICDHLQGNGVTEIGPGEIGIIAPYNKQVEKIQEALKADRDLNQEMLENILVGSVEKFQGKEFKVILLSTVRSIPRLSMEEPKFTLGFVAHQKRFNVALTRARALLIVVGDPRLLRTHKSWRKFIDYCYAEGGYCGSPYEDEYTPKFSKE